MIVGLSTVWGLVFGLEYLTNPDAEEEEETIAGMIVLHLAFLRIELVVMK